VTESPTAAAADERAPTGPPAIGAPASTVAEPATDPTSAVPDETSLPAEAFTERAAAARARGLPGAYIAGGDDPDLDTELARERPYLRLLIGMVAAIVLGGFVLGLIGMVLIEAGLT
jgi:hypothetical protein